MKKQTRERIVLTITTLTGGVIGFLSGAFEWSITDAFVAAVITLIVILTIGLPWIHRPASGSRNTRPS